MSNGKAPPRERLLRAAADLFYRHGVANVGVEQLCRTAGVSKKSMYQLFDTKDEVVAASLREFGGTTVAGYFSDPAVELTARERILYVFERLEEMAAEADFCGCPFVNTAVEMRDAGHPASQVARRFKRQLTAYFERHARAGGAHDPATLAAQLTVIFDGLTLRAVMQGAGLDGLSVRTATVLLDAAAMSQ